MSPLSRGLLALATMLAAPLLAAPAHAAYLPGATLCTLTPAATPGGGTPGGPGPLICDAETGRLRVTMPTISITGPIAVTGTFWQSVQPISASALPLPANAAAETGGHLAAIDTSAAAGKTDLDTAVTRLTSILSTLGGTLSTADRAGAAVGGTSSSWLEQIGCQVLASTPSLLASGTSQPAWCAPAGQPVIALSGPNGGLFDPAVFGSVADSACTGTPPCSIAADLLALVNQANPVPTYPAGFASTDGSGTTSGTAGTFTVLFAANAGRHNCIIQNPSTGTATLYIHAVTATTPTTANSFTIPPGQGFACAFGGVVITDQISVASTAASSPFAASQQ